MNPFKRAITNIKRQPVKTGVFLALIFILGTVLSAAISVRMAILATEEIVMMRIPAVAEVQFLDREGAIEALDMGPSHLVSWDWRPDPPTIQDISTVGSLPYVRDYDALQRFGILSPDLLKAASQQDGSDLQCFSHSDPYPESFMMRGVSNPAITEFEFGILSLVNGRTFYPEEVENEAMVAIISQSFATCNNLYVGATMQLHSAEHDHIAMTNEGITYFPRGWLDERFMIYHEILEFEIVGIFAINQDQVNRMTAGLEFHADFHNRIYVPITVADTDMRARMEASQEYHDRRRELWPDNNSMWGQTELPPPIITFLLYRPRDLGVFAEAAEALLPDFWEIVDLSDSFEHIISSMDTILEMADLTLLLAVGATMITLTLTISLFLRDRRQEIGIYMALGERKSSVLIQFLIEIFLVATVGIILALFTGNLLSGNISRSLFEQTLLEQMPAHSPFHLVIPGEILGSVPTEIPLEEILEIYDTSLNAGIITLFVGVSFVVTLVSTIAPIMQIVKLEPKKILY